MATESFSTIQARLKEAEQRRRSQEATKANESRQAALAAASRAAQLNRDLQSTLRAARCLGPNLSSRGVPADCRFVYGTKKWQTIKEIWGAYNEYKYSVRLRGTIFTGWLLNWGAEDIRSSSDMPLYTSHSFDLLDSSGRIGYINTTSKHTLSIPRDIHGPKTRCLDGPDSVTYPSALSDYPEKYMTEARLEKIRTGMATLAYANNIVLPD